MTATDRIALYVTGAIFVVLAVIAFIVVGQLGAQVDDLQHRVDVLACAHEPSEEGVAVHAQVPEEIIECVTGERFTGQP